MFYSKRQTNARQQIGAYKCKFQFFFIDLAQYGKMLAISGHLITIIIEIRVHKTREPNSTFDLTLRFITYSILYS